MRKMKSVFAVLCAAFSGLFLASVFAAENKTSTHVFRPSSNLVIDAARHRLVEPMLEAKRSVS